MAKLLDALLTETERQEQGLHEAGRQPHRFDAAALDRIDQAFRETLAMVDLAEQQLQEWRRCRLTVDQARSVTRLTAKVGHLRRQVANILATVAAIRSRTQERAITESELERVVDAFLGTHRRGDDPGSTEEAERPR